MGEWKVSHTYAGGQVFYQVYRLKHPSQIDHSGNREIVGTFDTEAVAEEYAAALNEGKIHVGEK